MMRRFSWIQLLWSVFGILCVKCESLSPSEGFALMAFKEDIYEDPFSVMSDWDVLETDPCNWPGISCSVARDHVLKINISGSSLKGFLASELHLVSSLEELILHGNKLIGTIPKEIGMLKKLKILDLSANQLSGPLPRSIGGLTSIVKINLRSNGLTGWLPSELGNLKHLEELRLDRNKLGGNVLAGNNSKSTSNMLGISGAGICRLAQLKVLDFSFNFFSGNIPQCFKRLPRLSFQGNCLQERAVQQRSAARCVAAAPPSKTHSGANTNHHQTIKHSSKHHHKSSKPTWLLALEIMTGTIVGSLFLAVVLRFLHKYKSKRAYYCPIITPWKKSSSARGHSTVYIDFDMLKDVTRISRQELEVACEEFSNIIGSSPDSVVYKGTMKGGPEIAVMALCIKEEYWTGYLELYFQKEIADLARLNHENTGKLLGYCRESSPFTRMLVIEYASNGTLYEHLHYGEGYQISWTRRMKIGIGIARGLKYLHTELYPPFTISELDSSAVYLTEDFSPKLVDFESWKSILARSEKNSNSIGNQGDICVLPNSLEKRHLDVQGNIYAFGVLLLEIVTGRPSYCKDKGFLVDWAREYLELPEVMSYLVDSELKYFKYDELEAVCEVVRLCVDPDSSKRPEMQEILKMLESKIDTSVSAELKSSSLAWAELALSFS